MVQVDIQILAGIATTIFLAMLFFAVVVLWDIALALRSVGDKIDKFEDSVDSDLMAINHTIDRTPATGGSSGTQLHLSGGTISAGSTSERSPEGQVAGAENRGAGAEHHDHPGRQPRDSPSPHQPGGSVAGADADLAGSTHSGDSTHGPADGHDPSTSQAAEAPAGDDATGQEHLDATTDPSGQVDDGVVGLDEDARASEAVPASEDDEASERVEGDEGVDGESTDEPEDGEVGGESGVVTDESSTDGEDGNQNIGRFTTDFGVVPWYRMPLDRAAIAAAQVDFAGALEAPLHERDDVYAEPMPGAVDPDIASSAGASPDGDGSTAVSGSSSTIQPGTSTDASSGVDATAAPDESAGTQRESEADDEALEDPFANVDLFGDIEGEAGGDDESTVLSFEDPSVGDAAEDANDDETDEANAADSDGPRADETDSESDAEVADGESDTASVDEPSDDESVDEVADLEETLEEFDDAFSTEGLDDEDALSVEEAIDALVESPPAFSLTSHDYDAEATFDDEQVELVFAFDPEYVELSDSARRLLRYQLRSVVDRAESDATVAVDDHAVTITIQGPDGREVTRWVDAVVDVMDRTLYLSESSS